MFADDVTVGLPPFHILTDGRHGHMKGGGEVADPSGGRGSDIRRVRGAACSGLGFCFTTASGMVERSGFSDDLGLFWTNQLRGFIMNPA